MISKNICKNHQKIAKMKVQGLALPSLPTFGLGSLHCLILGFGVVEALHGVLSFSRSPRTPRPRWPPAPPPALPPPPPPRPRAAAAARPGLARGPAAAGPAAAAEGAAAALRRRENVRSSDALHFLGFCATDDRRHPSWQRGN